MSRPGLTGRAAVLAVALCAVVLTLAYPLREYLSQRGEIASLEAQQRAGARQVAALEATNRRWTDPEYVRSQARSRLHFVLPGETGYLVLLPPSAPASTSPLDAAAAYSTGPWYGRLWSSVEAAGRAPRPR
ncbi:MAG: FtsB family cell division protein [Mycobacteriales bacterium]